MAKNIQNSVLISRWQDDVTKMKLPHQPDKLPAAFRVNHRFPSGSGICTVTGQDEPE